MASIFSTYKIGENRVTASILSVLRSLSLDRIQRILGALLEQSEFEILRFQNQPSQGGAGVPDALISSSIRVIIETKLVSNTVNLDQIKRHLSRFDKTFELNQVLLVLTPDDNRPGMLDEINDDRIAWASFASLDQTINELLKDPMEITSEREAFLLRELQKMLEAENLLANPNDTLIIPARVAWPEYKELNAYICQPNRSFQSVSRMGFYSNMVIHPLVPKILEKHEDVEIRKDTYQGALGKLVNRLVNDTPREEGSHSMIFILSPPDSPDTIKLNKPILCDKKSKNGRGTAFVQNQTYVSSDALRNAVTTSDLE